MGAWGYEGGPWLVGLSQPGEYPERNVARHGDGSLLLGVGGAYRGRDDRGHSTSSNGSQYTTPSLWMAGGSESSGLTGSN